MPIGLWLGLSALVVGGALWYAYEAQILAFTAPVESSSAQGRDAFTLTALYKRLTPEGRDEVQRYIDYFRKSRRRGFADALARSTRYVETFQGIFREAGLPAELAYLPLIESGYVETAESPAKAVGMFQFIEETGRRYDLSRNDWFDMRRDPISSARAAARYLGNLYETFNDWDLALAAYNAGAGTIRWAVRVNQRDQRPTDFWSLELPDETRNYVPAFIASMLIAKNPQAFGFEQINFAPELIFDEIQVSPGISLSLLANHMRLEAETLYTLNPELIQGMAPPGDQPYSLRIPHGMRKQVPQLLAGVSAQGSQWMLHHVRSQDTLQSLAKRYRAHPSAIRTLNGLQNNGDLASRSFVLIPH
ncbi:MAG: transglycosylase SLT domain-containing protein [Candidatus Lambdaproteobacteria bacterium]|nr:transglycosylase SLT domain-containing protein [Candidatus Lambdaproteobacteria bacterium]